MNEPGYWSDTRPNGQPIEAGTFCWVTEIPGQHPIYTYGKTKDEVIAKITRTAATAQAELNRTRQPVTQPAAPRARLTADETMQATADLANPAKSAAAVVRLLQDETGVDLRARANEDFATRAMEWQRETPDFYFHPGNQKLLTNEAARLAGGDISRITKEVLTQAFNNLTARGELFEAPENSLEPEPPAPPPNLHEFPGGNQVRRTEERPRGRRFATSTRSTSFAGGGQTVPSKTLKYTEADIRNMPESKMRALIESNDQDYADACEHYFGAASA